ncbi:YqcC family protein [Alteromonas gilva]|uniref:YqcC family protein n=1 Tax=Alteromonas gilva TaxID=2987522 RepID=A0ABT5L047_9ALTE|nr:YqcC family protein [Alteromonas gilva]MDC8830395.1 YqcC family protein [Alteromonas gilva]
MIRESHEIQHGLALVLKLKSAMTAAGLWSVQPPTAEALASQQPFACDTLSFAQWLQFIFIPRLDALLKSGDRVPPMSVLPMAQVSWANAHPNVQAVLAEFDDWSDTVHDQ